MKQLFLFILLFSAVNINAQEEKITTPQIAFKVPLGETVSTQGFDITFMEVLEDSRCPKDISCVWAGQAKIKVSISSLGNKAIEQEIIFGGKKTDPISAEKGFVIEAVNLSPYPTSSTAGRLEYVLLLTKKSI
jgi:hypothetical protein